MRPVDLYLKRRAGTTNKMLVYAVPADVQPFLAGSRKYVRKSTGTADLNAARRVAAELVARYERDFDDRRRNAVMALRSAPPAATAQRMPNHNDLHEEAKRVRGLSLHGFGHVARLARGFVA